MQHNLKANDRHDRTNSRCSIIHVDRCRGRECTWESMLYPESIARRSRGRWTLSSKMILTIALSNRELDRCRCGTLKTQNQKDKSKRTQTLDASLCSSSRQSYSNVRDIGLLFTSNHRQTTNIREVWNGTWLQITLTPWQVTSWQAPPSSSSSSSSSIPLSIPPYSSNSSTSSSSSSSSSEYSSSLETSPSTGRGRYSISALSTAEGDRHAYIENKSYKISRWIFR